MQWWCAAQDVAWSWTWRPYPGVWVFVGLLAVGFFGLQRRWGEDDPAFGVRARRGFAAAGLGLLWIALDWPVGALGSGYLASVHMVQFLLVAVAAPPLLLLGVPRPALQAWVRRGPGRAMSVLGHPIVAMGSFTALMALTHWPPVVDGLMAGQLGSFVLDMVWLASGLVFWWPVAAALPERSWLEEPFKIGYLIAATLVNTGVFAYLTFSSVPVYATFELAPPVGTLSTRDDQLVAGLLMKIGGAVVLWTSITILFFRWVRRSEADDASGARGAVASVVVATLLAAGSCGPPATTLEGPMVVGEPVTGERAALYFTVRGGAGGDLLEAVEVGGVGETSLHHTGMADGMMRMTPAPGGLPVDEGALLRLRPGGDHAMLESLERPLVAGDSVRVVLRFRSGPLEAWARVVPLADLEAVLDPSG